MNEELKGSSSVDPPQEKSREGDIPPEDLETITRLYQTCPKLWGAFKDIVHVVDLMNTRSKAADDKLYAYLYKIYAEHSMTYPGSEEDIVRFTAVSGFVEKGVALDRQILQDQGKSYVTEFPRWREQRSADMGTRCHYLLRNHLLNCAFTSPEFSLRLTKTGFLQDLMGDLRHIQYLSVEALERGGVFLFSMGTIHNCCMYPESAAMIRQLDLVPLVTPFVTKRGQNLLIQSIATAVLAHVVDEDQLHLLEMDAQLLRYFLNHTQVALATQQTSHSNWCTREVLCDLWLLARNDFNKRLMVAQGTLSTLCSLLDPSKKRSQKERKNAVAIISRLMEDPINLHICQNSQELLEVLKSVRRDGPKETSETVRDLLGKLEPRDREAAAADQDDRIPTFPHLAQLLADQCNVLTILRMGLVEFVLDELKVFTGEQGNSTSSLAAQGERLDFGCKQVLLALSDLASDHTYRREIMARGGLDLLTTVLQTGGSEEKKEAAKVVLALTVAVENRPVIQIHTGLTPLLEDSRQRADNPDLAQLAENIL